MPIRLANRRSSLSHLLISIAPSLAWQRNGYRMLKIPWQGGWCQADYEFLDRCEWLVHCHASIDGLSEPERHRRAIAALRWRSGSERERIHQRTSDETLGRISRRLMPGPQAQHRHALRGAWSS